MDRRSTEARDVADDGGTRRAYVRVVIIWLGVLAALWWLQQAYL
jgi:hypothetical protein